MHVEANNISEQARKKARQEQKDREKRQKMILTCIKYAIALTAGIAFKLVWPYLPSWIQVLKQIVWAFLDEVFERGSTFVCKRTICGA